MELALDEDDDTSGAIVCLVLVGLTALFELLEEESNNPPARDNDDDDNCVLSAVKKVRVGEL